MKIQLYVDGYFDVILMDMEGNPLPDEEAKEVLSALQHGDLMYSMSYKHIVSYKDLKKPLYKIDLSPTAALTYEWEQTE